MYPCSNAFHEAVARNNPQKILLIFPDRVFTNDDVNVENGVEFDDNFNLEEDLSIGQTTSNELVFSLFNDDRLLNTFAFGEFVATLGVLLEEEQYSQRAPIMMESGGDSYMARRGMPYLTKNGNPVGTQPPDRPVALLGYGGKLYCFCEGETAIVYRMSDMAVLNEAVPAFMTRKAVRNWNQSGYDYGNRILRGWYGGVKSTWEFVPLGTFIAERPKAPNVIEIDFTCHDRMTKFDKDMPSAQEMGITYPCTIGDLFSGLCRATGVETRTGSFINQDAVISAEPTEFETATRRQVLGWIAEAAASNARFDRDGYLVLDWIRNTNQRYSERDYTEFLPYWYETRAVGTVYNRSTEEGDDRISGNGGEKYLIQDNPLLKGVN